jgi:hypothetical protein
MILKHTRNIAELSVDVDMKKFGSNTREYYRLDLCGMRRLSDVQADFTLAVPESRRHNFAMINNFIDFYCIYPECGKRK